MQERGVTDFNAVETSGFSQRSFYVRGTAGVRSTHGSFATAYFQAMRGQVFRADPGKEDVILRIASAYEAASRRRVSPPACGPLRN